MSLTDVSDQSVLQLIVAGISASTVALWRSLQNSRKTHEEALIRAEDKADRKLEQCEIRHVETDRRVADLMATVGEMKGAEFVAETIRESLTKMHRDMMAELRKQNEQHS